MAAPVKPALKQAIGRDSWAWVPAIAAKSAPVVTELEAVTAFNFSCSIFGDQEAVSATTEKVSLPRLNCELETYEVNGATSYSMADLLISIQPQAATGEDGKKAWEAMDDYTNGFLVRRQDKASDGVFVAGDFVDVIPAQLGKKVPTKTSTGADGVYAFTVAASITSAPAWNVAVVAS